MGREGHRQSNHSFLNVLLIDVTTITKLHPGIHKEIEDNR
jgi:hypothetical protein